MGLSTAAVSRLVLVLVATLSMGACTTSDPVAIKSSESVPPGQQSVGDRCEVALTQDGNVQIAQLLDPSRELTLAPGSVAVHITGACPKDLSVSTAITSDGGTHLGEQMDGTRTLDFARTDTDLALTYQPCAEFAPGCRGPQETTLYPVRFTP